MMDENVDRRMQNVFRAFERHPEISREARTEVWNRCYEAVSEALYAQPPKRTNKVKSALQQLGII